MFPQFLIKIIAFLALIFAPLEALFSLGSSDSSSANTHIGSSVIDRGLPAAVTVPPISGSPRDLAVIRATEGNWVSTDSDTHIALRFEPVDDSFFDEDGNVIEGKELDHDPKIVAKIGCSYLEFTASYRNERLHQLSDVTETKDGTCTDGGAERAKFKLLMAANPKLIAIDDEFWLASRTQVMHFVRVIDY